MSGTATSAAVLVDHGKIGGLEEYRVDFLDNFAVGFGGRGDLSPLWITLEGRPVFDCSGATGKRKHIDERFAFQRFLGREMR